MAHRLSKLVRNDKKTSQQAFVKKSMKRALAEVRKACESGHVLPNARSLFDNIDD